VCAVHYKHMFFTHENELESVEESVNLAEMAEVGVDVLHQKEDKVDADATDVVSGLRGHGVHIAESVDNEDGMVADRTDNPVGDLKQWDVNVTRPDKPPEDVIDTSGQLSDYDVNIVEKAQEQQADVDTSGDLADYGIEIRDPSMDDLSY